MLSLKTPILNSMLANAIQTAACAAFPEHDLEAHDRPRLRNHAGFFEGTRTENTLKQLLGIFVLALAVVLLWKSLQRELNEPQPIHFQFRA